MKKYYALLITLIVALLMGSIQLTFADETTNIYEKMTEVITAFFSKSPDNEIEKNLQDEQEKKEQIKSKLRPNKSIVPEPAEKISTEEEGVYESSFLSEDVVQKGNYTENFKDGVEALMKDKKLSVTQEKQFQDYISENENAENAIMLYDFMYENFYTFEDLNEATERLKNGETLENIFNDYMQRDSNFTPKDYPPGYVESLIFDQNIGIDDLALAEILAFRNLIDFNEIINRLGHGTQMEDICIELNIINNSMQFKTINVTRTEILACEKELEISENEAIDKIVSAKKAKVDTSEVIDFIKSGKSVGEKLVEHYQTIFNE